MVKKSRDGVVHSGLVETLATILTGSGLVVTHRDAPGFSAHPNSGVIVRTPTLSTSR